MKDANVLSTTVSSLPLSVVLLSAVSVTHSQPRSRNKQLINFKLHAVLSNMMKSHAHMFHPTQDINYSFVQHFHGVYAAHALIT